jgi:hypothetical protein
MFLIIAPFHKKMNVTMFVVFKFFGYKHKFETCFGFLFWI